MSQGGDTATTRSSDGHPAGGRLLAWWGPADVAVARLAGAGLLAWMGWIHLHLWSVGYKHVHIVGILFLLNFIGAVALALAVLAAPTRLLSLAAAAGALTCGGTLTGLAISINIGLFKFKDSYNAPFAHLSIWVESAGVVVLIALAVRAGLIGWRNLRPRRAAT
jgi:hypothetical protein